MKTDFSAFWWLGGVSFLYGIVHAAGPGHGKVVISSYLLANEQRLRRGVAIAFLSALVQAIVAVAIVGLMAVLLNMTSMAITSTAKLFETGSFALVAALGLYLLARKGRSAWAMLRGGDPHAGHDHGHHGHGHDGHAHHHDRAGRQHAHGPAGNASPIKWDETAASCACTHHHDPAALEKAGAVRRRRRGALRRHAPCSGALVVLVFALAQGIFWAGHRVDIPDGARHRDHGRRAGRARGRREGRCRPALPGRRPPLAHVMLGLEVAAALFITALGAVLLAGSLAA
jgi:ABC-type nickel/cobalt efflux system permease component RcnA